MKRSFCLVLLLTMVWLPFSACAQQSDGTEEAYVYKLDGSRHCDKSPGISLDIMANELIDSGIAVSARRKSHDGREGIAVCGKPTGSINVYRIAGSDLARALESGFQRLDPSWLEPSVMKNDPRRPVKEISRDLGVTPDQFVACFDNVNPTPGGARPESPDRVHANKAVLLPCLQKANPAITNDSLDAVMDRYRPGGRSAQEPVR